MAADASAEDIKRAFRTKARESHPDANPGDPAAEERFRDVAELKSLLQLRRRQFAAALAAKLLAYAVGRELTVEDRPQVDALAESAAEPDRESGGETE